MVARKEIHRVTRLLNGKFLVEMIGLGNNQSFPTMQEAMALVEKRKKIFPGQHEVFVTQQ